MHIEELTYLEDLLARFRDDLASNKGKQQASEVNHVMYLVSNQITKQLNEQANKATKKVGKR